MYVYKKGKNIYKLQAEEIIKKFHGVPACFFYVYLNLICEKPIYVHTCMLCTLVRIGISVYIIYVYVYTFTD